MPSSNAYVQAAPIRFPSFAMLMPSDPAVLKDRHSRRISRAVGRDARVVSVLAALIALAVFLIDSLTPLNM